MSTLMWLALGGVVLVAVIPLGVHLGFRAPRLREVQTPADVGLSFEAVRIPTVRGRSLFGWWLAAPPCDRTVVVLHGWGSNAEMMLPIAAPLRRAGLNVLLVDASLDFLYPQCDAYVSMYSNTLFESLRHKQLQRFVLMSDDTVELAKGIAESGVAKLLREDEDPFELEGASDEVDVSYFFQSKLNTDLLKRLT